MCETIYILSGCAYIIFPACDCGRLAGNVTLTELATVERAIQLNEPSCGLQQPCLQHLLRVLLQRSRPYRSWVNHVPQEGVKLLGIASRSAGTAATGQQAVRSLTCDR